MIKKKTLLQKNCITFMFNKSYTSILCYCPVDTQPKVNLDLIPTTSYERPCLQVRLCVHRVDRYAFNLLHANAPFFAP